jgi:aryl-alcohol dehydrogenase-like predicted oxidoreductase
MAQTFGIALMPWGPLCGGLLTGKYRRDDQSAAGRWHGGKDNFGRPATAAAFDVIEGVAALAREKGCSTSQLALAWNAAQPGITAPIVGPRTLEQLVDNLGAANVKITDADRTRLDALAPPSAATLRYYDAALAVDFKPNLGRW